MGLFKKKKQPPEYEPQTHLYTEWEDKILKFRYRRYKFGKFLRKFIFWFSIVIVLICIIVGVVIGILNAQNALPHPVAQIFGLTTTDNNSRGGILEDIAQAVIRALVYVVWGIIIWPIGAMSTLVESLFKYVMGANLIKVIVDNSSFATQLSIIIGISIAVFALFLVVRAIKISHAKDGDLGHAIAKTTPSVIFWSMAAMILLPVIFVFINGTIATILKAIGNSTIQDMPSIVYNASWTNKSHQVSNFWEIGMWPPREAIADEHWQWGLCLFGWIGSLILNAMFFWFAMGKIFEIVYMYILLFPAAAKWAQDEGGAVYGIRDEMIGMYISILVLSFFYFLMGTIVTATNAVGTLIVNGGQIPNDMKNLAVGIANIFVIFVLGFVTWKMPKKIPSLFMVSRNVDMGNMGKSTEKYAGAAKDKVYDKTIGDRLEQRATDKADAAELGLSRKEYVKEGVDGSSIKQKIGEAKINKANKKASELLKASPVAKVGKELTK